MEKWKEIENYEEFYEVSNEGRVRRKSGYVKSGIKNNERRYIEGKILKQNKKRNGYLTVDLSKEHKVKTISIHRLVAKAFIENPKDLPQVNHKNGNKMDNRVENLEWVTSSENRKHSFDTGLQKSRAKRIRCKQLDMTFEGSYKAAEYINEKDFKNSKRVKSMSAKIRAACIGLQKEAYGYTWEYYI